MTIEAVGYRPDFKALAKADGDPWKNANHYYDPVESEMDGRWAYQISPLLGGFDFSVSVDLATGHGRNTRKLLEQAGCERVYAVDINAENADFCRARFAGDPRVVVIQNNGLAIPEIPAESVTCFYCYDSMVQFDSDIIRSYLAEIRRVLNPATGKAFLHHSNLTKFVGEPLYANPENRAGRSFMSKELLAHYALKEGLTVLNQTPLDWLGDGSFTDCFSILAVGPQ